jgi:hypothetical protein
MVREGVTGVETELIGLLVHDVTDLPHAMPDGYHD